MNTQETIQQDKTYICNTYNRFPIVITSGHGAKLLDDQQKEYIDFTSGIGVNSLGYTYQPWCNAVSKQAATLAHTSNLYYTLPQIEVAQKLCEKTGAQKVFFCNSGAEANEAAIKTARKWGIANKGENAQEIIALHSAFHGRTLGALAATPQKAYQSQFGEMLGGFTFATPNHINSVETLITPNTCAILMELIQGESGVCNLSPEFVTQVSALCNQHNILLIIDEVQTGIGRTGTFLATQQYHITPDIITLAKGLGAGLPVGATLFFAKTSTTLTFGDHGTTFGGNPIVMAGANVVIDTLTDEFLQQVQEKAAFMRQQIVSFPHVKQVTGLGLMIGIELDIPVENVLQKGMHNGILMLRAHDKLRLLPPLTITRVEVKEGLELLKKTLEEC